MALNKLLLIAFFLLSNYAQAEDMTFPQEELSSESVTAQLDSPQAVTVRNIVFKNRFEPHISYGWLLDEPFYQNSFVSAGLSYSWSEVYGVSARILNWGKGLSDYSNQFSKTNASPQLGRAYGPQTGAILSFVDRILYGKVSFSKSAIIPTALTTLYEIGMIKYGPQTLPLLGVGLSDSFYLTKSWSANLGLHMYLRQALDPLSVDLRAASPVASESSFGTTLRFSTSLDFGVQYLF